MREKNTALAVIDVQLDYFPGGAFPLWRARRALHAVTRCLSWARRSGVPVYFIRHEGDPCHAKFLRRGSPGCALHPGLCVRPEEAVITKHYPDGFQETDLEERLKADGVTRVAWTGMITWMCVDATVRSARAMGFDNLLVTDATASGWLLDGLGPITPWSSQRRFTAALGAYFATLVTSKRLIGGGFPTRS
jgi:nicotinamidase-related amidase